ncbi:hypothetical protein CFOLD11_40560 [Clostridium folliculivorans]|uniref:Capsular biosynthesis protein n=1 Tax=Clostridium folliculivorans TaxID=2886038 RepID=A0A9W5Y631_9CLOT|nr:glycosyltransferase [Clostridium folliculivorans]GKU27229.1 hypothetical protein CFOLD11_40560 [Clostridium folliculivorans]
MKKICILSTVNLKHMTLISLYTDYFDIKDIKYDIICVDKYGNYEKNNANNFYAYNLKIERDWPKYKKIIEYIKFKNYAQSIMEENQYDFIIVWNTYTALLFNRFLRKRMKNKYCFNIRDYAHEKNKIVFKLVRSLINKAAFTTISSKGYRKFLPEGKYITIHSFNKSILSKCMPKERKELGKKPIRISFIGYVRFFDIDKRFIDAFGNDSRFKIQYYGEGSKELEKYAIDKGYLNMEFRGRFEPQETENFINNTDVINNLYGVGKIALDTAISIKTYYAAYMRMPILVFDNTFMKDITTKYNFGYAVKEDMSNLANNFYEWYSKYDFEKLAIGCNNFIKEAQQENTIFIETLDYYFLN